MRILKKITLISVVTIWTLLVGVGFVWLSDYTYQPGLPANISHKIPKHLLEKFENNSIKLYVFIHPKCVCSFATMTELEKIISNNQNSVETTVFFYKPNGESDDWVKTDLWQKVKHISSINILTMSEEEMSEFGVITSGQALLYDADGNLVFSGGITIGRGHEGSSLGSETIENYLQTGNIKIRQTPVYGCLLTSYNFQNN